MRVRRIFCGFVVLLVVVTTYVPASSRVSSSTSAALVGRVAVAASGESLAGAVVTLSGEGQAWRPVKTDSQGRFAFSELPPGRYWLRASHAGHRGGGLGQRSASAAAQPVDLAADEIVTGLVLRLWPDAVISGMVVDESGDPVTGVPVLAVRRSVHYEPSRFEIRSRARTDDRGRYRMVGVPPGSYLVGVPSVSSRYWHTGTGHNEAWFRTTWFPGTADRASAAELTLGPGEERSAVDVPLVGASGTRLVARVDGLPPGHPRDVHLIVDQPDGVSPLDTLAPDTELAGRVPGFAFGWVPEGRYLLRVVAFPTAGNFRTVGNSTLLTAKPGVALPPVPDRPTFWAEQVVLVGREPLEIHVTVQPGRRVRGRVVFEGSLPQPSPELLATTPVVTQPADGRDFIGLLTPTIGADGGFTTQQLPPGRYSISLGLFPPPGWSFGSLTVDGRSVAGHAFELADADLELVMTMTDRPAVLTGTVRRADGAVAEASVFIFPTDRRAWRGLGLFGAFPDVLAEARTTRRGAYRFEGLAAGEYYVTAVEEGIPDPWQARAFLESLVPRATVVSLTKGVVLTRDLRVAGGSSRW